MYVWWCSSLRMVNIGEFHERKESMSLTEFENLCLGHIDAAKEQLLRRSAVLCRRWWWSYRDECGLRLFMCWTAQQHLRLAASHQLTVLLHRRVTYGGRTFAVAVPSTWNSLLKCLCDPSNSASVFGHLLITFFSQSSNVYRVLEASARMCYINWRFTLHYIGLTFSCVLQQKWLSKYLVMFLYSSCSWRLWSCWL